MVVSFRAALAALTSVVLGAACTSDNDADNRGTTGTGSGETGEGGEGSGSSVPPNNTVQILVTNQNDPDLINPWGIVGRAGLFWIADNGTGKVSVYTPDGRRSDQSGVFSLGAGITGVTALAAGTSNFLISKTGTNCAPSEMSPAEFVFASETGMLIAINGNSPPSGVVVVDRSGAGAVYKGVTEVDTPSGAVLLAANFVNGRLDMFDSQFRLVDNGTAFVDVDQPAGWGPFNVIRLGDNVYVTEAKIGEGIDEQTGPGLGAVAIFDLAGNRVGRITSDLLNAPWGVAVEAATTTTDTDDTDSDTDGSGDNDNDSDDVVTHGARILVGNFGDGRITAFDPATGNSLGQLFSNGKPFEQDGLWGITLGSSDTAGTPGTLYFVAGPQDETAGVFGRIELAQ